jgi:hypothetical protein
MRRTLATLLVLLLAGIAPVRAAEPITIGFAEALTGGLAVVGKSGVLAARIWADEVNAKGGLLGRPVKLVFYLVSPGFAQSFGSGGEAEGLHFVGVLSFDDEFGEDVVLVSIEEKFGQPLA